MDEKYSSLQIKSVHDFQKDAYHNVVATDTWRGKVILQLMLRRENLGSICTTGELISGRLLKATAKLGCMVLWSRCML